MKKIFAILLCAVMLLSMAACGSEPASAPEKKNVDLNALYESFSTSLPEMWVLDEEMMLNMYGIKAEDCTQVITAIVKTGLNADEIWLIEAKDEAALEQLKTLANSRMQAKADETIDYLPDQYVFVEKGVILTEGLYLALIVSPDVDNLKAAFEAAVK